MIERGPYGAQYIVAGLPDSVETDYQMDILMQARPAFVLPVYRQSTSRGHRYAYPVTGLESIAERVSAGKPDTRQMLHLVKRLRQDLAALPDHLLMAEQVLLRPEALFLNPSGERLLLVYRPFTPVDGTGTLDEFIQWLGQRLFQCNRKQRRWIMAALDGTAGEHGKPSSAQPVMLTLFIAAAAALIAGGLVYVAGWRRDFLRLLPDWRLLLLAVVVLSLPLQFHLLKRQRRKVRNTAEQAGIAGETCFSEAAHLAERADSGSAQAGMDQSLSSAATTFEPMIEQPGIDDAAKAHTGFALPIMAPAEMPASEWQSEHLRHPDHERQPAHERQPGSRNGQKRRNRSDVEGPGLAARLNPMALIKRAADSIRSKAADSPAQQERMHEMPTELLSSRQELFRLATLSEGMIGTGAEAAGQRAFILNDEFLIGRDFRTSDLCLSGHAVGRQHARINRQGAAFFITDLGSKNGTRLNGERLGKHEAVLLPDRCQLQFADRLFYFEAEQLPIGA